MSELHTEITKISYGGVQPKEVKSVEFLLLEIM
jgi:hypothetical protein